MRKGTVLGLIFWALFTAFCVSLSIIELPQYFGFITGNLPQVTDLINESGDGDIPSGYAKIQVDAALGSFATKTETQSFITTETEYYIAWLPDDSFMTVMVQSKKDKERLDELSDMTWDYLYGNTSGLTGDYVELTGEVKTIDSDVRRMFEDTLREYYGVTEDE